MGLLSKIFGSGGSTTDTGYKGLLEDEKARTAEEEATYEELKKKQEAERLALKKRGSGQQGGGRTGLMFGQNQAGVA